VGNILNVVFVTPWLCPFLCCIILLPDSKYSSKSITVWKIFVGAFAVLLWGPTLLVYYALANDHSSSGLGDIVILLLPLYLFGGLLFSICLTGLIFTEIKSAQHSSPR